MPLSAANEGAKAPRTAGSIKVNGGSEDAIASRSPGERIGDQKEGQDQIGLLITVAGRSNDRSVNEFNITTVAPRKFRPEFRSTLRTEHSNCRVLFGSRNRADLLSSLFVPKDLKKQDSYGDSYLWTPVQWFCDRRTRSNATEVR